MDSGIMSPTCPVCGSITVRSEQDFKCLNCGKCLPARHPITLRCKSCGLIQVAIASGAPVINSECQYCHIMMACQWEGLVRFSDEKEAIKAHESMVAALAKTQKIIDMLPYMEAYGGDSCTCESDEYLPEDHDKSCPIYQWFIDHLRAAESVVEDVGT